MQTIDPIYRTVYSELEQRALDAAFVSEFPPEGRFVSTESRGRKYWYFDVGSHTNRKHTKNRPAQDPEITKRVEAFKDLKADFTARRTMVTTLTRDARLPRPDTMAGDIIQALANAGFFRLRGVLVGTMAFQCYSALLGVRLPSATLQTADADFAQFHSISAAVGDSLPPVSELLKSVDPTFREIPHSADPRQSTKFRARSGYAVEFLTPNTGSEDHVGRPATMPALGHAAAEPLRFLDFLFHEPARAVVLHSAGIPVLVPRPARYAVHKLIVAARRRTAETGQSKAGKDLDQAAALIEALLQNRMSDDFAEALVEALDRGPHWRSAIGQSLRRLEPPQRQAVVDALRSALPRSGQKAADYLGVLLGPTGDAPP